MIWSNPVGKQIHTHAHAPCSHGDTFTHKHAHVDTRMYTGPCTHRHRRTHIHKVRTIKMKARGVEASNNNEESSCCNAGTGRGGDVAREKGENGEALANGTRLIWNLRQGGHCAQTGLWASLMDAGVLGADRSCGVWTGTKISKWKGTTSQVWTGTFNIADLHYILTSHILYHIL